MVRYSIFMTACLMAYALNLSGLRGEEREDRRLQRIAFGSCASEYKPQPIWKEVIASKPELFLFLGDNIYADTEDMELMKKKYGMLANQPGFQSLQQTCPIIATWDDHDYGTNDGGHWYPKKKESQQIMLDFFQVAESSPRRQREGIYESFRYGPVGNCVQVILLDTRYFKSRQTGDVRTEEEKKQANVVGWYLPNTDPQSTILGEDQWKWLEEQLRMPAEIRIIASSIQVIADEKGMESWGNFPHERKRLYDLIEKTKANGVFFISGDVHFSEISRTMDGPYPLYDFTSSGLTNSEPIWAAAVNSHRYSPIAYAQPTAGLIEIDWKENPIQIQWKAIGIDQVVPFEVKIGLDELQVK